MSLGAAKDGYASKIRLHPAEINWHVLDKLRLFFLGTSLFSGGSATLYPAVVLKTRQQVSASQTSYFKMSFSIVCAEGFRGFYRGFGTSFVGTIPALVVYMAALEVTTAAVQGLGAAMASGVSAVITMPLDTIKTRLQVQENGRREGSTVMQMAKSLVEEGRLRACYRGLGLRCASMAMSAATMVTTCEFLKKLPAKDQKFLT